MHKWPNLKENNEEYEPQLELFVMQVRFESYKTMLRDIGEDDVLYARKIRVNESFFFEKIPVFFNSNRTLARLKVRHSMKAQFKHLLNR